MTDTPPTATVAGQSIALHVTGYPDVPNRWGSGHVRVTGIRLDYGSNVSPDARHAFVTGLWVRDDGEATDAPLDRYYDAPSGNMSDWPDWIAELTRQHTPTAEAQRLDFSTTRAKVLATEADEIVTHCPDHGPQDQDGCWMDCHCAVADDIRRRLALPAEETR